MLLLYPGRFRAHPTVLPRRRAEQCFYSLYRPLSDGSSAVDLGASVSVGRWGELAFPSVASTEFMVVVVLAFNQKCRNITKQTKGIIYQTVTREVLTGHNWFKLVLNAPWMCLSVLRFR